MQEKDLIKQLKGLKDIKPNHNWAVSLKSEITGNLGKISILELLPRLIYAKSLAYVALTVFAVAIGILGISTTALPGDLLFPVKKIAERSQASLLSSSQPENSLQIANKRLKDLTVMVKENKDVESAKREYSESVSAAVVAIANAPSTNFKNIAAEVKILDNNKRSLETMGVIMLEESNELNNALAPLIENEINELNKITNLTLDQEFRLVEIKSHYKKGEYTASLEKILLITQ